MATLKPYNTASVTTAPAAACTACSTAAEPGVAAAAAVGGTPAAGFCKSMLESSSNVVDGPTAYTASLWDDLYTVLILSFGESFPPAHGESGLSGAAGLEAQLQSTRLHSLNAVHHSLGRCARRALSTVHAWCVASCSHRPYRGSLQPSGGACRPGWLCAGPGSGGTDCAGDKLGKCQQRLKSARVQPCECYTLAAGMGYRVQPLSTLLSHKDPPMVWDAPSRHGHAVVKLLSVVSGGHNMAI